MTQVFDIIGYIFVALGVLLFLFTVLGLFRFGFIMNRMHAAAMGDGLAFGVTMIGLAFLNGPHISSLKFIFAGLLLFFASPICSHIIARYEVEADPRLKDECEVDEVCT